MSDLDIIIFAIAGVAIVLISLYVVISMTQDINETMRKCNEIGDWAKKRIRKENRMSELIDRQAAIDAIVQCTNCGDEDTLREYVLKHSLDNGWTGGILEALDAVKDLPSAQPEPHEGEWINKGIFNNGLGISWHCWECSKCHSQKTSTSNYCPNCGAKMRGEQDEL